MEDERNEGYDPIESDDMLDEILALYPETREFLESVGMHCLECEMAGMETLSQACRAHRLSTVKVKQELNRIVTGS